MFNFYLNDSYQNYFETGPHFLSRNVTWEIQAFRGYLFHLSNLFRELLAFLVVFIIIFLTNYKLALAIVFIFFIISYLFSKTLKPSLKKRAQENQNLNQNFSQMVYELFGAIKDIKLLNKEKQTSEKFKDKMKQYENNLFFFIIIERLPKIFLEITAILFIVILITVLSLSNESTPELLAFLSVILISIIRSIPAFTGINSALHYMRIFEPSVKILTSEIYKINNKTKKNEKKENNKIILTNPNKNQNLIDVNNITFKYSNKNKAVLNNASLFVKKGQTVGIIGKTGSGKSTLMQILIGLLKPDSGNVFFEDKNISEDLKGWQQKISYVSQSIFLFDETLRTNITFENEITKIDQENLEKAIEVAELKNKILSLPKGLDENVGTDGIKLSGGEKQRIALARAIYKNKLIIFLDEFTSALDIDTENKIISNLNNSFKDRTLIIIAHRKNIIEKCDVVWELKDGILYKKEQ